jgi:hypothetical protein
MEIPLKAKYRESSPSPKHGNRSSNSGTKRRKKSHSPETLLCHCGGEIGVYSVFRERRLQNEFRCPRCKRVAERFEILKEDIR